MLDTTKIFCLNKFQGWLFIHRLILYENNVDLLEKENANPKEY